MTRDHIYALDVLRFISACLVMTFHLCFYAWASPHSSAGTMLAGMAHFEPLAPFTWFGWVGVEVFFVISGFVIANSAAGAAPAAFLKGRILRLYPAVWVCATITLTAWMMFAQRPFDDAFGAYARSMVLWIHMPWIDGVYWSLAVEIVFYALVFWILVAGRFLRVTMLPWLLTALQVFYTWMHANYQLAESIFSPRVIGELEWLSSLLLLKYGAFFALGIWFWMMSRRAMNVPRYVGVAVAIGVGLLEVEKRALGFAGESNHVMDYSIWPPMLIWLGGVALVYAAARHPKLFEVRSPKWQAALKRIGLMTYPLFLVHGVLGAGLIRAMTQASLNPWLGLFTAISVALLLAYFISATLEVSIRKLLRSVLEVIESVVRGAVPALGFLFRPSPDPLPPPREG